MKKIKVLISACLLGEKVKYSGKDNLNRALIALLEKYPLELVPICPEVMGGLPIPRPPAEIVGNDVITVEGKSVSQAFMQGAEKLLKIAKQQTISLAILKEKSPSCGSQLIYDGTFTNTLIKGEGITAKVLREHGITVFSEQQLEELEHYLQQQ